MYELAEDETPEPYIRPTTLLELKMVWALRDDLYARRPTLLSDAEIAGIKFGRTREVEFLRSRERARGYGIIKTWFPPDHGQGL